MAASTWSATCRGLNFGIEVFQPVPIPSAPLIKICHAHASQHFSEMYRGAETWEQGNMGRTRGRIGTKRRGSISDPSSSRRSNSGSSRSGTSSLATLQSFPRHSFRPLNETDSVATMLHICFITPTTYLVR
jgi:hypothetical protein